MPVVMRAAKPPHVTGSVVIVVVSFGPFGTADLAGGWRQDAAPLGGLHIEVGEVARRVIPAPLLLSGRGLGRHTRPLLLVAQVAQRIRPDATCRVAPSALHFSHGCGGGSSDWPPVTASAMSISSGSTRMPSGT